MKDLVLCVHVVVKNLRRRWTDDVKKLCLSACRTCSTIIFPHSTKLNQIIVFRGHRCRCPCLNSLERFSDDCRKTKSKAITLTNHNRSEQRDEPITILAMTCNSLKAREKSRVCGAIGFGFASHWLKKWPESFKPITKRSNRNHVITFDSHLKTVLFGNFASLSRVNVRDARLFFFFPPIISWIFSNVVAVTVFVC